MTDFTTDDVGRPCHAHKDARAYKEDDYDRAYVSEDECEGFTPPGGMIKKLVFALLTLFGEMFYICTVRSMYKLKAVDAHGVEHYFNRPYFVLFLHFLSESLCLLVYFVQEFLSRSKATASVAPARYGSNRSDILDEPQQTKQSLSLRVLLLLGVAAVIEACAFIFLFGGALWVTSSVVQMFAGLYTIFSALLSRFLLKKYHSIRERVAVAMLLLGVLIGGFAHTMYSHTSAQNSQPLLGLLFLTLAWGLLAGAATFNEFVMDAHDLHPTQMGGIVGCWGLLMLAIVWPLLAFTPAVSSSASILLHDDFLADFAMLRQSSSLAITAGFVLLSLFLFNFGWFNATKVLSALSCALLSCAVAPCVWLFDLSLTYVFQLEYLGTAEVWCGWSFLQLLGMLLVLTGNLLFFGVLDRWIGRQHVYERI